MTPMELRAKVVYHFECSCNRSNSYIGKTKRHLAIRTKEHLRRSSAIFDHTSKCHMGQHCSIENFKVIGQGRSDLEIKIKEALLIKDKRPSLNNQILQNGSSFLLNVF